MKRTIRIEKIQIENRSKWEWTDCFRHVMNLVKEEQEFISKHRDVGCTFRYVGAVNVSILPVSQAAPEDTLYFYIHNDTTRGE